MFVHEGLALRAFFNYKGRIDIRPRDFSNSFEFRKHLSKL
jgi:hypothetical protein